MSTFIQPVTPVATETASVAPTGSITSVSSGQAVVVTQATVGPAVIDVPATGSIEVSSQALGANIVIEGTGTAEVFIGTATTGGNPQTAAGTAYQIADDYQGTATVNLTGSIVGESKVDLTTETPEGSSIAENAPTGTNDLDFYVKTGAGNDQVQGTDGVDFIRLGAGNDSFNAGDGDDIVRVGIGNDSGTLGAGDDILYLTVDQLQGNNVNTITDFDAVGNDKIQLDADLQGLVEINGTGTSAITITLTGAQTGTTAVVSQGESIDADDIEFV